MIHRKMKSWYPEDYDSNDSGSVDSSAKYESVYVHNHYDPHGDVFYGAYNLFSKSFNEHNTINT